MARRERQVVGLLSSIICPRRLRAPVALLSSSICHRFALGFSPSTKEHKLFRFSFSPYDLVPANNVEQSVCTLDGSGGEWRQRSYRSRCPLLHALPPVLVDGKLYLLTTGRVTDPDPGQRRNPDGLLEVDVATEAHRHRTFRLPLGADEYDAAEDPHVNAFEMSGRLCLAVNIFRGKETTGPGRKLPEPSPEADCPQCDQRLQLPPIPSNCELHMCGGYRPSMFSPLTLAPPPKSKCWDGEEERQEFENALMQPRHYCI